MKTFSFKKKSYLFIFLFVFFTSIFLHAQAEEEKLSKITPRQQLQNVIKSRPIITLTISEHEQLNVFVSTIVEKLYPELSQHMEIHVHVEDLESSNASIFTPKNPIEKEVGSITKQEIHIFITKGLIAQTTQEEFSFVVGHEIGHLDSAFVTNRLTKQVRELEADHRAISATLNAGLDPESGIDFFQHHLGEQSGSFFSAFLAAHPPDEKRIYAMRAYLTDQRRRLGRQYQGSNESTPLPEFMKSWQEKKFVHPLHQEMIEQGFDIDQKPTESIQIFIEHYRYKKSIRELSHLDINFFIFFFKDISKKLSEVSSVPQGAITKLIDFYLEEFITLRPESSHVFDTFKTIKSLIQKNNYMPEKLQGLIEDWQTICDENLPKDQRIEALKRWRNYKFHKFYLDLVLILENLADPDAFQENQGSLKLREKIETLTGSLKKLMEDPSTTPEDRRYIRNFGIFILKNFDTWAKVFPNSFLYPREEIFYIWRVFEDYEKIFKDVESYEEYEDLEFRNRSYYWHTYHSLDLRDELYYFDLLISHESVCRFINEELKKGGEAKTKALHFLRHHVSSITKGRGWPRENLTGFSEANHFGEDNTAWLKKKKIDLLSIPIVGEPILTEDPFLVFCANLSFFIDHREELYTPWMTFPAFSVLARLDKLNRGDLIRNIIKQAQELGPSYKSKSLYGGQWDRGGASNLIQRSPHLEAISDFLRNSQSLSPQDKAELMETLWGGHHYPPLLALYAECRRLEEKTVNQMIEELRKILRNINKALEADQKVEPQNEWKKQFFIWKLNEKFKEDPSSFSQEQFLEILKIDETILDKKLCADYYKRYFRMPNDIGDKIYAWIGLNEYRVLSREDKDRIYDEIYEGLQSLVDKDPKEALKLCKIVLPDEYIDRDSFRQKVGCLMTDAWIRLNGQDTENPNYYRRASKFLKWIKLNTFNQSDSQYEIFRYFAEASLAQRKLAYKIRSFADPIESFDRGDSNKVGIEIMVGSALYAHFKDAHVTKRRNFILWLLDRRGSLPKSFYKAMEINEDGQWSGFTVQQALSIFKEYFWTHRIEHRALLTTVLLEPMAKEIKSNSSTFKWVLDLAVQGKGDPEVTRVIKSLLTVYYDALPNFEKSFFLGGLLAAGRGENAGLGEALNSLFSSMGPAGSKLAQAAHTLLVGILPEEERVKLSKHKTLSSPPTRWGVFEIMDEVLDESFRNNIIKVERLLGSASIKISVRIQMKDGKIYALNMVRPHTVSRAEAEFEILEKAASGLVQREGESYQIIVDMIQNARKKLHLEVDQSQEQLNTILARNTVYSQRRFQYISIEVVPLGPEELQGERFTTTEFIRGKPIDQLQNPSFREDVAKAIVETELDLILSGSTPIDLDRHFGNFLFIEESNTIVHLDFGQLRKPIAQKYLAAFIKLSIALNMKASGQASNILLSLDPLSALDSRTLSQKIEELMSSRGGWENVDLVQRFIIALSAARACEVKLPEDILDLNSAIGKLNEYRIYFSDPKEVSFIFVKKGIRYGLQHISSQLIGTLQKKAWQVLSFLLPKGRMTEKRANTESQEKLILDCESILGDNL